MEGNSSVGTTSDTLQGEENLSLEKPTELSKGNVQEQSTPNKEDSADSAKDSADVVDDTATNDTNSDTIEVSPAPSIKSFGSGDFEEPLTPVTDVSSKSETSRSQTGSGRVTPGSQSDHSVSLSSSDKSTPNKKRKSTESAGRQTDLENQAARSVTAAKRVKFPVRANIQWKKGEKLEAMDYMRSWFPAKIKDIDPNTLSVLIHFDGWNQRYDEWVEMASDRIRPLIRHSERKDKRKQQRGDYKIGEQVYAKWTDCKMYPAKVTAVMPNGSYEVIFYDGFKKQVQPINLRSMPGEHKKRTFEINPVPAEVIKKSRMRKELIGGNNKHCVESVPAEASASQLVSSSGVQDHLQFTSPEVLPESTRPVTKERKPLSEKGPRVRRISESKSKRGKIILADLFKQASLDGEDVKTLNVVRSEPAATQTVCQDKGVALVNDLKDHAPITDMGFYTHSTAQGSMANVPSTSHVLPPKAFVVESDHNRYKCHFEGCNKGFRKEHLLEYHIKYYHMVGASAPPLPPPSRKRRKTASSTDSESTPTGKRAFFKQRRHLSTESGLAQDVDMDSKDEIGLPVVTHSSMPETGESSTQTTPVKSGEHCTMEEAYQLIKEDLGSKHHRSQSQDSNWTEDSSVTDLEGEDSLKPDELVNCICDFYEENGLMIQCEVCMCWQHAGCFGITERTLPKTYVCFVCENPPGVRESAKHVHEQDWLKNGEIPYFDYTQVPPVSEERRNIIKATNSLVTDLHQLDAVLHSLKLQLKILRTKDEKKLRMWRMDWDVMEQLDDSTEAYDETSDDIGQMKDEHRPNDIKDGATEVKNEIRGDKDMVGGVKNEEESKEEMKETNPAIDKEDKAEIKTEAFLDSNDLDNKVKDSKDNPDNIHANTNGSSVLENGGNLNSVDCSTAMQQEENKTQGANQVGQIDENSVIETKPDVSQTASSVDNGSKPTDIEHTRKSEIVSSIQDLNHYSERMKTEQSVEVKTMLDTETEEANHSDSTESAVEDPLETCEKNLLNHIFRVQEEISKRMDQIEEQVALLEAFESAQTNKDPPNHQNIFSDMPQLKRNMKMMHDDLYKVKKMSVFH